MQTSHQSGGPGGLVRPGLAATSPAQFRINPANDNPLLAGPLGIDGATGLLLQLESDSLGAAVVTIRVMLEDGGDCVLYRAYQGHDVIAIWRGLGRDLDLPLYLAGEGEAPQLAYPPRLGAACPRRGGSPLSHRRPRFLARRKGPLTAFGAAGSPRMQKA